MYLFTLSEVVIVLFLKLQTALGLLPYSFMKGTTNLMSCPFTQHCSLWCFWSSIFSSLCFTSSSVLQETFSAWHLYSPTSVMVAPYKLKRKKGDVIIYKIFSRNHHLLYLNDQSMTGAVWLVRKFTRFLDQVSFSQPRNFGIGFGKFDCNFDILTNFTWGSFLKFFHKINFRLFYNQFSGAFLISNCAGVFASIYKIETKNVVCNFLFFGFPKCSKSLGVLCTVKLVYLQ